MTAPAQGLRYAGVCVALGLALGWLPGLVHGPIAAKWDVHAVNGELVVWGYRVARFSIGFWVGITALPRVWFLRGPLCGFVALLPLGFVSLSNSLCGPWCMFWNLVTASAVGFAVAGLAWSITGRNYAGE